MPIICRDIPTSVLIQKPREIEVYLRKHAALARLVPSICRVARDQFGPMAELHLEIYKDPETAERDLVLFVRLPIYNDDTMERIYKITEAFDEELSKAAGWFQVTTDFRVPQENHAVL
jgi:hypothetical protein